MNGQPIAQENVAKAQRWISERDIASDYVDYERQGKINSSSICAKLDFARSVINQNPTVKVLSKHPSGIVADLVVSLSDRRLTEATSMDLYNIAIQRPRQTPCKCAPRSSDQ